MGEPRVCQRKQSNEVVCLEQGSLVEGGTLGKVTVQQLTIPPPVAEHNMDNTSAVESCLDFAGVHCIHTIILLLDMGVKTDMMPMSAHEPKGKKHISIPCGTRIERKHKH